MTLEPLPGALVRDWKKCGQAACKCARGQLHGPYFVRVWSEGGKRRKAYVKASEVPRVRAEIELFELRRRLIDLQKTLRRRISRRDRETLEGTVIRLKAEIEAIFAKFAESSSA